MAINVKAAMLICMAFIGGVSWVVERFEARPLARRSPVVASLDPLPVMPALGESPLPGEVDPRTEWVRRLARPNAFDLELQRSRSREAARVLAPAQPVFVEFPATTLPPLVYHADAAVESAAVTVDGATTAAAEAGVVVAHADEAGAAPAGGPRRYRVAAGDTLSGIARREWQSNDPRLLEVLAGANPQLASRRGGRIQVGEELLIPDRATVAQALAKPPADVRGAPEKPVPGAKTVREQWYTIQPNDTLAGIALKFLNDSRRWREIVELNGVSPRRIVPGTRIRLPAALQVARG